MLKDEEKFATITRRTEQLGRIIKLIDSLPDFGERVFLGIVALQARFVDMIGTQHERNSMALLEKTRERMAPLSAKTSTSTDTQIAETGELSRLLQNPDALAENLESDDLDLLLIRCLTNLEKNQSDFEAQILEISAINDAVDHILGKKQAPS
jgi:hypothetical protein